MKISSYEKKQGHNVKLLTDYKNLREYDIVYVSKVFTDTDVPIEVLSDPRVKYGGTGFYYDKAPRLPDEIEHVKPDYGLYTDWANNLIATAKNPDKQRKDLAYFFDYSIGFTTRGCIRGCSNCVNKNYKKCSVHSPVNEFLDENKKYICLLDDNVFACKGWQEIFHELQATGKPFQFKQGMDERLLTDEKCDELFNKSKWIGDYIFAFDNIKDAPIIRQKLDLIRKYTAKVPKFYVFCGYNHDNPDNYTNMFWLKDIGDTFERIRILMQYKCLPYLMRYKDYEMSPYRGMYITIARWCNQPSFFKKKSFREFIAVNGDRSSAYRYAMDFERNHPEVAKAYFDLKYENI
jgi:hypothetical protein